MCHEIDAAALFATTFHFINHLAKGGFYVVKFVGRVDGTFTLHGRWGIHGVF